MCAGHLSSAGSSHSLRALTLRPCCPCCPQRDFGVYVVNLFDTGQAARVLEMPGHGLAYLLEHYCSFKVDPGLGFFGGGPGLILSLYF